MPNMKTLGAILIVSGLLLSIIGYGTYENVMCHCASQTAGSLIGCHCTGTLQQGLGHVLVYSGLAVAGGGMIVFTHWWRKKIIFN
ncbi:MAG TPA: hypothetical protein VFX64_03840 [Candidatus Nitrosotalea sp.]|nr:hypothetical protein [Candidatus Nitrosotalea sp.]